MDARLIVENPLAALLESRGAVMAPISNVGGQKHTQTALSFGDEAGELEALTGGVGLLDLTARGLLVVEGADRASWLHGLCTQDIKKMPSGGGGYACHIDIKGRIVADMRVGVFEEMILLDVEPGMAASLRRLLKRFVVMERVTVADRSAQVGTLGLAGPGAAATLGRALGEELSAMAPHGVRPGAVGDLDVLVSATDQLGGPGFRISTARESVGELFEALERAGARPCGWEAMERSRIRAGVPRFGAELGPEVLFNEAGLDTAVSFTKGCYLGQEIVERVDARGKVGRRLMGLVIEGSGVPAPGGVIANGERALGEVTSSARVGARVLAMGYIHRADNAPGSRLVVRPPEGQEGEVFEAVIVERGALAG